VHPLERVEVGVAEREDLLVRSGGRPKTVKPLPKLVEIT
jgi:hypothetical protein